MCIFNYLLVSWIFEFYPMAGARFGLSLAVLTGCGAELSGAMGSFSSPGYPDSYPANKECIWYIHTDPGSSIQLTIHDFDVEYHASCRFDVLEVGI